MAALNVITPDLVDVMVHERRRRGLFQRVKLGLGQRCRRAEGGGEELGAGIFVKLDGVGEDCGNA